MAETQFDSEEITRLNAAKFNVSEVVDQSPDFRKRLWDELSKHEEDVCSAFESHEQKIIDAYLAFLMEIEASSYTGSDGIGGARQNRITKLREELKAFPIRCYHKFGSVL